MNGVLLDEEHLFTSVVSWGHSLDKAGYTLSYFCHALPFLFSSLGFPFLFLFLSFYAPLSSLFPWSSPVFQVLLKALEHALGPLLLFKVLLSFIFGLYFSEGFPLFHVCWLVAVILSDLKLYYLVTLQFVSGLIQIVSMDKLCIIHKKISSEVQNQCIQQFSLENP